MKRTLVTGATGFVGRALVPALRTAGHEVRATTRDPSRVAPEAKRGVEWVACDVHDRDSVAAALEGIDSAYFLVHGMGNGAKDYAEKERAAARTFAEVAAEKGVKRIVYLGGVAPEGAPSEHLASRLGVGEILRAGTVKTVELRASMIIGQGSASWQIVRDLAMRLPAMLLPSWTASRTSPVAIDDVVVALVRALDVPLEASEWFDIPGPEVLSGRDILQRLAALRGRRVPSVKVPFLSVSLSSWWLKLVARTDFSLARELVLGFTGDLLARDDRYWGLVGHQPSWTFEAAAKKALDAEQVELNLRSLGGKLEESIVQLVSPKLASDASPKIAADRSAKVAG